MKINIKNKVFFIAEAGVNHNGDIKKALEMVSVAKNAGADCIKFQAFTINNLVSDNTKSADYQANTGFSDQKEMLKKLILEKDDFIKIRKLCDKLKIQFLCTAFDNLWLDFYFSRNEKNKNTSGEINASFLNYIASKTSYYSINGHSNNKKFTLL